MIEEETGQPVVLPTNGDAPVAAPASLSEGKKLIARDAKNNPLFSELDWAQDAIDRDPARSRWFHA